MANNPKEQTERERENKRGRKPIRNALRLLFIHLQLWLAVAASPL